MKFRLIKLDVAAKRVGCHVETLRLRIRSGRLKAVRGPHGAYFISTRSFLGLRVRKPPPWKRRRPTAEEREAAWETAAKRLRRQSRAFDELIPFLVALKVKPSLKTPAHRLICAHGLRDLGFGAAAIAAELGVSTRHARRLIREDLAGPIAGAAHRWAQIEARRLVRELREGLKAEGFRFHQWVMRGDRVAGPPTHRDRPRPAFKLIALTRDEKISLRAAGLTNDQIWAIGVIGIGSDELNELQLHGLP
ncbi:hypothetical protein EPN29_10105 [bacterium]|nr:MAG: hypothetical protein EPN29_10105 [bacterium]